MIIGVRCTCAVRPREFSGTFHCTSAVISMRWFQCDDYASSYSRFMTLANLYLSHCHIRCNRSMHSHPFARCHLIFPLNLLGREVVLINQRMIRQKSMPRIISPIWIAKTEYCPKKVSINVQIPLQKNMIYPYIYRHIQRSASSLPRTTSWRYIVSIFKLRQNNNFYTSSNIHRGNILLGHQCCHW